MLLTIFSMFKLSAFFGVALLCLAFIVRQTPPRHQVCYSVVMQTFAGTNTLSYPVGVFDIDGTLLGNAASAGAYVTLWNNDTADARLGTLALGRDSMHFNLNLNTGQILPSGVTGLRYFQVDLAWNQIDGIRQNNGEYIDFGDGTRMRMPLGVADTPTVHPANTVYAPVIDENNNIGGYYYIHNYADSSLKTITCYHNDGTENSDFDNYYSPATSETKLQNLRGNLPANTTEIGGSSYQQASMTSLANIVNWNAISSVTYLRMNVGDSYISPFENVGYPQDFLAKDSGLQIILTSWGGYRLSGVRDTTFKLSRLKSDWNTYFKQLNILSISDDHWNREDLSSLVNLDFVLIAATTTDHENDMNNLPIPIPSQTLDSILIQLAAGAGQHVSNGFVELITGGTLRTSASDAAVAALQSKGWTVSIWY